MKVVKTLSRVVLGVLYILAGVNHFVNSAFYLNIMPPYLPWHGPFVFLSGVAEVLLGALVLIPRWSVPAAWGLIALLVAIFPANIHMAFHPALYPTISQTALWLRLPLQGVLVLWAWWHTTPQGPRDLV